MSLWLSVVTIISSNAVSGGYLLFIQPRLSQSTTFKLWVLDCQRYKIKRVPSDDSTLHIDTTYENYHRSPRRTYSLGFSPATL